jgi:polyisoprenoid-binding protein YceI
VAELSGVPPDATEAAVEPTAVVEPEPQVDPNVEETTTPQPEPQEDASFQEDEPVEQTSRSLITFEIVPAESQARFVIDEVLRGAPKTVVGTTDQVAGQLALDPVDLSSAQVGTIQVNARTLATDNDFRNRAIKNRILLTDSYEFVTFDPSEVIGLPEIGAVGESYTFQIAGDLTITDVTRPVTFDVVASATSEGQIEGTATTAFLYTDFELFIPDAPAVDTVEDEVRLELDFVAQAVE